MRRLKMLILLLLCCLPVTGSAFAQGSRLGASLPTQRMLGRYGLTRAWSNQATLDSSRDRLRHLTIDEDMVYMQSTGGNVTAFDNETGKRVWSVHLGRRDQPSFPAVSNEDIALIVAGSTMYALNKFSGQRLWNIRLPGLPSTSPTSDNENVYVGMLDGSLYAFEIRKIERLYNEDRLPQWSHQTIRWRYKTAKEISTPPVVAESSLTDSGFVVNFASLDRSLYSVSTGKRKLKFQFETDAAISAPLGHADGLLYLASEGFSNRLYCLNAKTGAVRWVFPSGLPVRKAPRIIGGDLYLTPERGGMYSLSATSGIQQWWRPKVTGFLAATPSMLFVSDQVRNVVLLDRKDGALIGSLPLRHFKFQLANDRTDRLYLATESGLVVCIREKDREFPEYYKYPERRPILPLFAEEAPAPPAAGIQPPAPQNAPPNNAN